MADFWNVMTMIAFLAVIYSLISIFKPLRPYPGRVMAIFGTIAMILIAGTFAGQVEKAKIAVIDAEKAERLAARERLKQNDPAAYAALVAEEAERDRKAAEALQVKLASERERHAKEAARSVQIDWEEADWAEQIKKTNRRIETVTAIDQQEGPLKGELVRVTYYDPSPWSESTLLYSAAQAYLQAAQAVLEHKPTASGIQFIVKADAVDEYKRTETVFAFVFSLSRAEMNKIVWDKMIGGDMLNLSTVDRKSLGRSIARSYCDDHADKAERFCQSAAR